MRIQSMDYVQQYKYKQNAICNNTVNNCKTANNYLYNPIAYRDYNISFGDRLFRTPENFYAQTFNKENMPDTMASYLYENYDDRKHIPPAQMMRIVFNDVNNANTIEEVKEFYPNEPLFANLHSMDNRKYREGILAEISYLKEPGKSLFKNGKDDLGLYILKKIYIEGKTLKEINKDFKKDVSVVYSGISEINYRDLANFGIKFPKGPFWHSFYVTREDFPYVSVKRKDSEFHANGSKKKELTLSDINNGDFEDKRPPKYIPKDHEIKDITGAIMEDFGDKEKTNRNLKRKFKSGDSKLTFIQKYMSEIMSISLDRVHASDEMRTFFEDYENIDKSARSRMKKYWDTTPEMKALQGLVMSDTIKLFFVAYGPDGNNDIFRDLIDYAHSIRPNREKELLMHNEKQNMYNEIFADYDPESKKAEDVSEYEEYLEELKGFRDDVKKLNEYISTHNHVYNFGTHNINLQDSIENMINEYNVTKMGDFLPASYLNKYTKFLKEHQSVDDKFLLSVIIYDTKNNAIEEILNDLYTPEETSNKLYDLQIEFMKKYLQETRAAHQAMVTTIANKVRGHKDIKDLKYLYNIYPLQIADYKSGINVNMEDSASELTKYYSIYRKPVSTGEAQKIALKISELLRDYDASISHMNSASADVSEEIKKTNEISKVFKYPRKNSQKFFKEYIIKLLTQSYGGSSRAILDKDLPECVKVALMEDIILSFSYRFPQLFSSLIMFNDKEL